MRALISRTLRVSTIPNGHWICKSCLHRSYADQASKPFYITTPIFYVNADPHLGHLYSMIQADVIKRWQQLQGRRAIMLTGVDEHGLKVQKAADEADTPTQEFCNRGAETFKRLAQRANVGYDYFARTTSPRHRSAVQHAWTLLEERGYIYESNHEGWYSVGDETFYPESGVHVVVDPATGRKKHVSIETGSQVEWNSEVNYKFRLSAFQDRLLDFYESTDRWIEPAARMNQVKQNVAYGLEDLSISRPAERVQWGIPVPHDNTQNVYVWLDALMNYTVQAGYPWSPEMAQAGGWPADVHIIGKDIIRFHTIYWPAFLMALELPLPKRVVTHAHWTIGGHKMSKSTGNVVNPFLVMDKYGTEAVRWYLAYEGKLENDADYNNLRLAEKYDEMRGKFGNFVTRLTRSRMWSLPNAIESVVWSGLIKDEPKSPEMQTIYTIINTLRDRLHPSITNYDIRASLHEILTTIYETNAWFHNCEPWRDITKDANQETMSPRLQMILALSTEVLRICSILLIPYMPDKMNMLLDQLGVDKAKRNWDFALLGSDTTYRMTEVPLGKGKEHVIFPPVVMN